MVGTWPALQLPPVSGGVMVSGGGVGLGVVAGAGAGGCTPAPPIGTHVTPPVPLLPICPG